MLYGLLKRALRRELTSESVEPDLLVLAVSSPTKRTRPSRTSQLETFASLDFVSLQPLSANVRPDMEMAMLRGRLALEWWSGRVVILCRPCSPETPETTLGFLLTSNNGGLYLVSVIQVFPLINRSLMRTSAPGAPIQRLVVFFSWLVRRSFRDLGIKDAEIADYVSVLLANFARTENLYRIRMYHGRTLETAVEMLLEANLSWYS